MSDWGATHDNAERNALGGLDMEQPGDWIVIGEGVHISNLNALNKKKNCMQAVVCTETD